MQIFVNMRTDKTNAIISGSNMLGHSIITSYRNMLGYAIVIYNREMLCYATSIIESGWSAG